MEEEESSPFFGQVKTEKMPNFYTIYDILPLNSLCTLIFCSNVHTLSYSLLEVDMATGNEQV